MTTRAPGTTPLLVGCRPEQVHAEPGGMSVGPDAAYLTIVVRLAAGEVCNIRLYPPTTILDRTGLVVETSRAGPGPAEYWALDRELPFDLLWATLCGAAFARPLTAAIGFVENAPSVVQLPNSFEPASCGGGRDGLYVEPGFNLGSGSGG